MDHLTLWVNAGTFAVCAASLVLTAGVYARKPSAWLKSYLLYHGSYALWLLIFTYYFFRLVYLPAASPTVDAVVAGLRLVVSAAILWSYPGLVMRTLGDDSLHAVLRIVRIVALAVIIVPTSVAVVFGAPVLLLRIVNLCFNAYLLLLTGIVLVKILSPPRPTRLSIILPLYWISLIFYLYAVIAGSVLVTRGISSLTLSAFSASLYCLPWSLVMGWRLFRDLSSPPDLGLRKSVAIAFAFTPREREVVEHVLQGLPNKHIARTLGVSLRTVEAHLYNAFRKCHVRSRTELIRRIQSEM